MMNQGKRKERTNEKMNLLVSVQSVLCVREPGVGSQVPSAYPAVYMIQREAKIKK